jgi:hypothetical protein
MVVGIGLARNQQSIPDWIQNHLFWLQTFQWIALIAFAAKAATAAFSTRRLESRRLKYYVACWLSSASVPMILSMFVWDGLRRMHVTVAGLTTLLIPIPPLLVPLNRIGLAAFSLSRNRHR